MHLRLIRGFLFAGIAQVLGHAGEHAGAELERPLRVLMVVFSSLRWRIQGRQHEQHPDPDRVPPSIVAHHPPALGLVA